MKELATNWSLLRFIHLVTGIIVLIMGIQTGQWILALPGALFALLALLNKAGCSAGSCPAGRRKG